ncbi:hypothetical protein ACSBLW_07990 [Thioclava sp. FR2]|uniref:hypothetical protein n=1 Tax=Thioclava sp. FR2 TaxID=3445780 RepID=UPI003EB6C953
MLTFQFCKRRASAFAKDESGAVTVDWVVMTAAICGIGMLLFTQLTPAIFAQASDVIAADIRNAAQRN